MRRASGTDDQTPFLAPRVRALGAVTEVVLEGVTLALPSAAEGAGDRYRRTFVVRLAGGRLLGIRQLPVEADPDLLPRPSAERAAEQLAEDGEAYLDFAVEPPALPFHAALDRVLGEGVGSPQLAREIDGLWVLHQRVGETPRAAWVVELRGLPPFAVKGPRGADPESVPRWQRNHLRNVVDGRTGRVLFANNLPHPEAPGGGGSGAGELRSPLLAGDPELLAVLHGRRLLRRGSRGEAVRKVQRALVDLGYPLPRFGADGRFGAETEAAVRRFQADQRRVDPTFLVDGIVGPQTLRRLDALHAARAGV